MDAKDFLYTKISKSGSEPITESDIAYFQFIEKIDEKTVISAINELLLQHKIVKFYYDTKTKMTDEYPSKYSVVAYRPYYSISDNFLNDLMNM